MGLEFVRTLNIVPSAYTLKVNKLLVSLVGRRRKDLIADFDMTYNYDKLKDISLAFALKKFKEVDHSLNMKVYDKLGIVNLYLAVYTKMPLAKMPRFHLQ